MLGIFDLLRDPNRPRYGTGIWPLSFPRPWNLHPPPGVAALIDPVAVAAEVASELRKVGWPGVQLMDFEFQMALLDGPVAEIGMKVGNWFETHRGDVADLMEQRLPAYGANRLSKTAETAMK